jgi:hypothetical protein
MERRENLIPLVAIEREIQNPLGMKIPQSLNAREIHLSAI